MGLDLAELVHELQLVHADVTRAVAARQVAPVGGDPDAAHAVPLIMMGKGNSMGNLKLWLWLKMMLEVTQVFPFMSKMHS